MKGYLVIDGEALYRDLYNSNLEGGVQLDWIHKGQYPEYRAKVVEFFQCLKRAEITPTVVFDGVLNKEKKLKKMLERHKVRAAKRYKALQDRDCRSSGFAAPQAHQVFHATLDELGVEQLVADGDGDEAIVQKAKKLNCPVLSLDADFYMTDLPKGYIPLDRLLKTFPWQSDTIIIEADVFHVSDFMKHLEFKDKNFRFVIPAVRGNDYLPRLPEVESHIYRTFPDQENAIMRLIRYMKRFNSFETFVASIPPNTREKLSENYHQAIRMYGNTQLIKPDVLASACNVPQWVVDQYRCGKLKTSILSDRFLGYQMRTPSGPEKLLKQYAYGILGIQSVTTYEAKEGVVNDTPTLISAMNIIQGKLLPNVSDVERLSPKSRQLLLYRMLACDHVKIEILEEKWKLVIASVVFWARERQITENLVKALLVCFLLSSTESVDSLLKLQGQPLEMTESWREHESAFTGWQYTYINATVLNQLLKEPLQSPSAAFLFDGKLAMRLAAESNIDRMVMDLGINNDLYQSLIDTVLSQYDVPLPGTEGWKIVKRHREPQRAVKPHAPKLLLERRRCSPRDNSKETETSHKERMMPKAEPISSELTLQESISPPATNSIKIQSTQESKRTPQRSKVAMVPYKST